jgi:hypothetical protein
MEEPLKTKKHELQEKIHYAEQKKTLFSEMSRLFHSFSQLLKEHAKTTTIKEAHVEAHDKKLEDMLTHAQNIAQGLSKLKEELFHEVGDVSYNYVAKSLDPIIDQAMRIIEDFREGKKATNTQDVLNRAIYTAQLYSQFRDEKKLRRKIIKESIGVLRSAIEKDSHVLHRYYNGALESSKSATPEIIDKVKRQLEPIFHGFQELLLSKIDTDDLKEFFLWKAKVDHKRAELIESGLSIIDSLFGEQVEEPKEEAALKDTQEVEACEADWFS